MKIFWELMKLEAIYPNVNVSDGLSEATKGFFTAPKSARDIVFSHSYAPKGRTIYLPS